MKTIWKWDIFNNRSVLMPVGAKILAIKMQNDCPVIWAQVDSERELERRNFRIYGTGHSIPDNPGEYVGTVMTSCEAYVWHVFEVTNIDGWRLK